MIITSIKTKGANTFVDTDAGKSFVINKNIVGLVPVAQDMEITEDGDTVTINGQSFRQQFNEHNNVWELLNAGS